MGIDGLGKEEILIALSAALHTHVLITPRRMESIRICGFPTDKFICDPTWAGWRVQVVERRHLTQDSLDMYNSQKPTIGIVASGWGCRSEQDPAGEGGSTKARLYRVPYSLHSSVRRDCPPSHCLLSRAQIPPLKFFPSVPGARALRRGPEASRDPRDGAGGPGRGQ